MSLRMYIAPDCYTIVLVVSVAYVNQIYIISVRLSDYSFLARNILKN